MNNKFNIFISIVCLFLLISCSTETNIHTQARIERTKIIFNDSAKTQKFETANYNAVIENYKSNIDKNQTLTLNFEIEINMGFEDMELKYIQPEEFDLNLIIYDNQNNLREKINLDFDLFDKLYFSYDRTSDKDIAILQKKITIENEYFELNLSNEQKQNLKNKIINFLNIDKIELVFDYEIDGKEFTKKITPKININSINRDEKNFNLTTNVKNIFDGNAQSKMNFEINALKTSEDNSIYFPTSEKVFLNIYKLNTSNDKSDDKSEESTKSTMSEKSKVNEELVFESNKKMNYLQVVDEDLPFINASKEYYYDWSKKDNSNNYLTKGLYRFEIGLRTNKNNDKVNYYIYYR